VSHTTRRRALAAAATALLALAPSAPAAERAPQPGPANYATAVAAQPGALTGTHAQTPSDINRATDANFGAYTPGAIPAVSYPSGGAYTPGSIPAVSYPSRATAGGQHTPGATAANSQPSSTTATRAVSDPASGGVNPTTIGLGVAGSLLAIAGIVGLARRSRRRRRIRTFAPDQMWANERTKA
jgi:hypothetical protein